MKSRCLFLRSGDTLKRIFPQEILYFKSMGRFCQLKTRTETIVVNKTIGRVLKMLPEEDFIRIHSRYIVSINNIHMLVAAEKLPIGKLYLPNFCNRVILVN